MSILLTSSHISTLNYTDLLHKNTCTGKTVLKVFIPGTTVTKGISERSVGKSAELYWLFTKIKLIIGSAFANTYC